MIWPNYYSNSFAGGELFTSRSNLANFVQYVDTDKPHHKYNSLVSDCEQQGIHLMLYGSE